MSGRVLRSSAIAKIVLAVNNCVRSSDYCNNIILPETPIWSNAWRRWRNCTPQSSTLHPTPFIVFVNLVRRVTNSFNRLPRDHMSFFLRSNKRPHRTMYAKWKLYWHTLGIQSPSRLFFFFSKLHVRFRLSSWIEWIT